MSVKKAASKGSSKTKASATSKTVAQSASKKTSEEKSPVVTKKAASGGSGSVGEEIDKLFAIEQLIDKERKKIAKIEAGVKELQHEYDEMEKRVFELFAKEDIEGAIGKKAQAAIDAKIVANITDPKRFYKWMEERKAYDILQRRINNKVYREMSEEGKKAIPGLAPFRKVRIKLTPIKK